MKKYELIVFINGCVCKRVIGSKRKCVNEMVSFGVPYKNFLGIKKKTDRFSEIRAKDLIGFHLGENLITKNNSKEQYLVIEFEMIENARIPGKEIRHYFLCPFIFSIKRDKDKSFIVKPMKNLLDNTHCHMGYQVGGRWGYVSMRTEDLMLGNFPIKCKSDTLSRVKTLDPDKVCEFVRMNPSNKPYWYGFVFDNRCAFIYYSDYSYEKR